MSNKRNSWLVTQSLAKAIAKDEQKIVYFANTMTEATHAMREAVAVLGCMGVKGEYYPTREVRLHNGSTIRFMSVEQKKSLGFKETHDMVIIDDIDMLK